MVKIESSNTPTIRFQGFSGEWCFREIHELISEGSLYPPQDGNHGEIHPKKSDYVAYGIPFIMANNIRDGIVDYRNCSHITQEQAEELQKGFAKAGDVLLTHKGTVGEIAIVYDSEFPFIMLTPQVTYYRISNSKKLDVNFLAFSFATANFQNTIKEASGGGTRAYIGIIQQRNLSIAIPPERFEQTQIGTYFKKLDRMIELHQRKHNKLVTLKQAMLQKMFPQDGASTPEIRFKGFSGDWEEKSFKFITSRTAQFCTEEGLPRLEYEDIISSSGRLNKDLFKKRSDKKGIKFQKGDVLFGKLRPYLKNWLLASFEGIAVGDFWVLRPTETDSSFLYRLIQTNQFDDVANQSAGSKMPRSDWNLVSNAFFYVPSTFSEQQKIGTYFRKLDDLIAKHTTQLQKLKQIKSACLEKMFV